jgi:hypothetical protein
VCTHTRTVKRREYKLGPCLIIAAWHLLLLGVFTALLLGLLEEYELWL